MTASHHAPRDSNLPVLGRPGLGALRTPTPSPRRTSPSAPHLVARAGPPRPRHTSSPAPDLLACAGPPRSRRTSSLAPDPLARVGPPRQRRTPSPATDLLARAGPPRPRRTSSPAPIYPNPRKLSLPPFCAGPVGPRQSGRLHAPPIHSHVRTLAESVLGHAALHLGLPLRRPLSKCRSLRDALRKPSRVTLERSG